MKSLFSIILLALSVGTASAAQQSYQLARIDGSIIHYTLDVPLGDSAGILVLAQGSSCEPAAAKASLATVRAAFPTYTAVIVEKHGIAPDSSVGDGQNDCPPEFLANYTLSQRINDYEHVLAHLQETATPSEVILFGGSEGGLAMEALPPHPSRRRHPALRLGWWHFW